MVGEYGSRLNVNERYLDLIIFITAFEINYSVTWKDSTITECRLHYNFNSPHSPVGIALDLKLEVVDSIPGLVNLTIINCLSNETLNRGPV